MKDEKLSFSRRDTSLANLPSRSANRFCVTASGCRVTAWTGVVNQLFQQDRRGCHRHPSPMGPPTPPGGADLSCYDPVRLPDSVSEKKASPDVS